MRRVLIIDDEEDLRYILSMLLTEMGYDVVVAENGQKGVELFNKVPGFDLVITDIHMPGMDGNDIARFIRNSNRSDTPLVAITAYPEEIVDTVFDFLFTKPFKLEDFKEVVRSFAR
jgi:two-component system response regulator RegX3